MPQQERVDHWLEGMGIAWLVILPFVWTQHTELLALWFVAAVLVPLMALLAVCCLVWLRDRLRELRGYGPEAE
jgi:hypothetical protein